MKRNETLSGFEVLGFDSIRRLDILRCPTGLTRWLAAVYRGVTRIVEPGIDLCTTEETGRRAIGNAILEAAEAFWLSEETTVSRRQALNDSEMVRRFADGLHDIAYPKVDMEEET